MDNQKKELFLMPNGNVMGNDSLKGWMTVYWEYLESQGIDPTDYWIEGQLNHGEWKRIIPFRTETGWNVDFGQCKDL